MNEVQNKLLSIAKEFIRVCDILNLQYYAIAGTCLGAIRHNGFIPWDDDMDFAMPRNDYDVFVKKAKALLPRHLFVQTHKSDKNYYYPFCKLRDSNTTMIEKCFGDIDLNQGCWIDIFPLDGVPCELYEYNKLCRVVNYYLGFIEFYYDKNCTSKKTIINVASLLLNKISLLRNLFYWFRVKESKRYHYLNYENVWFNWVKCKTMLEKKWLGKGTLVPFEDINIFVPCDYETYLSYQYGNWKVFPPVEKRNSGHIVLADTKKPFKDFIKENKETIKAFLLNNRA